MWVVPRHTLAQMLSSTAKLAEAGHGHTIAGHRTKDPGAGVYLEYVAGVTPLDPIVLAAFGVVALGFVHRLRKHYAWLLLSLLPYLVMIAIAPKKLSRYALPAAPLLLLLCGLAIEWLTTVGLKRLKHGSLVVLAALVVYFGVRYA